MRVTAKWTCCAAIAFVTDRLLPDSGTRHRSSRSRRQQISQLLLTNRDDLNSGSSSDTDSHTRRILIHAVSNSFTAHIMVLMTMAAKSANAACLSGDIRPECIGVYKLPIDAAESPYVATPEKLKVYAPDLQWVPPTPYPTTYTAALKQLNDERQHLHAGSEHLMLGCFKKNTHSKMTSTTTSSKMPIGDPESSRSMNWMETGNDRTNGTDGICVESCPASCDGVERHGRIAVGGTTNERCPNWSSIHSERHWNEHHCLNTTSSCFEWIIPAPSQLAGQLSTQIPSVPLV